MDRSLSSDAVVYPASITVIKQAAVEGSTSFSFSATPLPLVSFSLVDDGTTTNTRVFNGITNFTTYSITELATNGWSFTSASCSVNNSNGGSQVVVGLVATIALMEGENVTCTFLNSLTPAPAISLQKSTTSSGYNQIGDVIKYDYIVTNSGNNTLGPIQFQIDDDRIDDGAPFNCGSATTTLTVGETVTCSHLYQVTAGDVEAMSVTNHAFAMAGELLSTTVEVTIGYVASTTTTTTTTTTVVSTSTTTTLPPETTTTIAVLATTTLPAVTTTQPLTTTTLPVVVTTVPIVTTTQPSAVTTVPLIVTTTTAAVAELQVEIPADPDGSDDRFDVLFPDKLPISGTPALFYAGLAALLVLVGTATAMWSRGRKVRNP